MPALTAEWTALAETITAGANPPTFLLSPRFWHDGEVPADVVPDALIESGAPWAYGIFGQEGEGPGGFVNQPGDSGSVRIHWWANSKMNASRVYEWFFGLVNDVHMVLDNNTLWKVTVRRLPGGLGPDGRSYQAIADVQLESVRA